MGFKLKVNYNGVLHHLLINPQINGKKAQCLYKKYNAITHITVPCGTGSEGSLVVGPIHHIAPHLKQTLKTSKVTSTCR